MYNKSSPKDRVEWIDYAKGICIIWVVTLYATIYVLEITGTIGWMQRVVDFAQPFRMPDFFLLSGLFVSRVIDRPWRSYVDSKVLHFLYFYVLWVTLKFINLHLGNTLEPLQASILQDYFRMFIDPPTGPLWFIYILALFFILVRATRRFPVGIVLFAALSLQFAVTFGEIQWSWKIADKIARYFIFFYSGYVFAPFIFRTARWAQDHVMATSGIFLLWFVINEACVATHTTFLPGMQLLLGFAGAFAIMLAATLLAGFAGMGWLRYLGKHSLVVYLGFVIPLGILRRLVGNPHVAIDIGTLSLLIAVLSIAGAMLLYWLLRNTFLRFLFVRPAWAVLSEATRTSLKGGQVV